MYEDAYDELEQAVLELGFPAEFAQALSGVGGEKSMQRLAAYLRAARPTSMEEIADEMLSIMQERDTWVERKKNNYYNEKLTEFYNRDREDDELDDND